MWARHLQKIRRTLGSQQMASNLQATDSQAMNRHGAHGLLWEVPVQGHTTWCTRGNNQADTHVN